jgi:hypothetical protein
MIEGVPAGSYKVLGAFENDQLVRDPDFGQGNTEIVRVDVVAGQSVEAPSFKITGSLDVISPGAEGAEEVDGNPVFSWVDDSGEDRYHIQVFDTFGELIWEDPNIPSSSGSDPEVPYAGPPLDSGMYSTSTTGHSRAPKTSRASSSYRRPRNLFGWSSADATSASRRPRFRCKIGACGWHA